MAHWSPKDQEKAAAAAEAAELFTSLAGVFFPLGQIHLHVYGPRANITIIQMRT